MPTGGCEGGGGGGVPSQGRQAEVEDCPWPPDRSKAVEHRLLLAIKHRQHHLSPSPSTPRLSGKRKVSLPAGIFPKACSFPLQDTRSPSPQSPAPEPSDHLPHFGVHLLSSPPPPPLPNLRRFVSYTDSKVPFQPLNLW